MYWLRCCHRLLLLLVPVQQGEHDCPDTRSCMTKALINTTCESTPNKHSDVDCVQLLRNLADALVSLLPQLNATPRSASTGCIRLKHVHACRFGHQQARVSGKKANNIVDQPQSCILEEAGMHVSLLGCRTCNTQGQQASCNCKHCWQGLGVMRSSYRGNLGCAGGKTFRVRKNAHPSACNTKLGTIGVDTRTASTISSPQQRLAHPLRCHSHFSVPTPTHRVLS